MSTAGRISPSWCSTSCTGCERKLAGGSSGVFSRGASDGKATCSSIAWNRGPHLRVPNRAVVEQLSTMYATPRACMYGSSESTASMTDSFATSDHGCPCAMSRSICAIATPQNTPAEDYAAKRKFFASHSIGGYPFVGTPDRIAEDLAAISRSGVRGIALSFVNYLDELPYFRDEVLPRLARLGVREAR